MTDVTTAYSTAATYWDNKLLPQWAAAEDAQRIASYLFYEQMYWNTPSYTVEADGGDPIHIPSMKELVEATHRFLAVNMGFVVSVRPEPGVEAPPAEETAVKLDTVRQLFEDLFKREQMSSKLATQKRYGLIRGDAMFHVVADETKPEGTRISIYEMDPASYFPIYDIDNMDRLVGCHIVEQTMEGDTEVIKRQTYRKQRNEAGEFTGVITTETALFELAGWDDRYGAKPEDIKQVRILQEEIPLPAPISSLPVYHWKNTRNPADPFGSSVFRGLETLARAIDQAITDEDIAVALAGLGVFATDAATPEGGWVIGPGRVVGTGNGTRFERVSGVSTVQPSQDHIAYLEKKMRSGAAVPDMALGLVDVSAAESGIALALRLAPLLATNREREQEIMSVMDHLLYDLKSMWLPAYESIPDDPTIRVTCVVDDPMPVNRDAVIAEITTLLAANLITVDMAIAKLEKLGWEFPANAAATLMEQAETAAALADPFGGRMASEVAGATDGAE